MRISCSLLVIAAFASACALSFEPLGLESLDGADASGTVTDADARDVPAADAEPSADAMNLDAGDGPDLPPLDAADSGPVDAGPDDGGPDLDGGDAGLEVVITLGMSGATDAWFHSRPAGLDCLGSGRFSVPYASVWEVEAASSPTRVFNRWTRGPCGTSTVAVCRFTADQDLTLRADYDNR